MRTFKIFSFVLVVALAVVAVAQDAPKAEVAMHYSLLVYNPAKNLTGSRNLSGGGGAFVYNFSKYLGMKAEFNGYGSTGATFQVAANPPSVPVQKTVSTEGNMFTYLFGPQISIPVNRIRIFGEGLFGGAHTNMYSNLIQSGGIVGVTASNNGFAMAFGGGLDIMATKSIGLRVAQVDYLLTRYEYPQLGINNQSNFRYQAGVVFRFGGR